MIRLLLIVSLLLLPRGGVLAGSTSDPSHSEAIAIALFPDLLKEDSLLFKAVERNITEQKTADTMFFENPQWPLVVAVSEAVKLGIQPVTNPEINPHLPSEPQNSDADEVITEKLKAMTSLQRLKWALEPKGTVTPAINRNINLIVKSFGGNTPDDYRRLRAIADGATIADVEAISQTQELRKQTQELRYQSDRLDDIQDNQERR